MSNGDRSVGERLTDLENALQAERESKFALEKRIDTEAFELKEALLWQEHRVLAALRNVYTNRNERALRFAAIGGFVSAMIGRTAAGAVIGGGVVALGLAIHANWLLSVQNEKMDVQTIVMDAQRRTQNFQAEFGAVSSLVQEDVARKMRAEAEAKTDLRKLFDDKLSGYLQLREKYPDLPTPPVLNSTASGLEVADAVDALQRTPKTYSIHYRHWYQSQALSKWEKGPSGLLFVLDPTTTSRVVALSLTVRPFPILETELSSQVSGQAEAIRRGMIYLFGSDRSQTIVPRLLDKRTSFERGQLLTFLTNSSVSIEHVEAAGADFSFSDMSARLIANTKLSGMPGSSFKKSVLRGVSFSGDFSNSDFACSDIRSANLLASFDRSSFRYALIANDLEIATNSVKLSLAFFLNVDLTGAVFRDVILEDIADILDVKPMPLTEILRHRFPNEHVPALPGLYVKREGKVALLYSEGWFPSDYRSICGQQPPSRNVPG